MKKIFTILLALAFVSAPIFATETEVKIEQSTLIESNKDLVEFTRASFEEGEMDSFLKEMDKEYRAGVEAHELEGLVAFLKQTGKFSKTPDENAILATQEKNKQLLALVENEEKTVFVEKIQNSAEQLKPEVVDAFKTLSKLQMKEPGTGDNADENKIIDLSLEHLYKMLHLTSLDVKNKKQKQTALEMDFFRKLQTASTSFKDEKLKGQVALIVEHADLYLVKTKDTIDLASLRFKMHAPQNELEKKVAAILE